MVWCGLTIVLMLFTAACGANGAASDPSADRIPGLPPSGEVPLTEVEPAPGDGSFEWTRGLEVGDLPAVNVGNPTEERRGDAHREDAQPGDIVCLGSSGSVGCGQDDPERGAIAGLTFGHPDVAAWSWTFVPEDAAAVRFVDHDGRHSWQRPVHGIVIFPDTVEDDRGGNCACRFDAIDVDGQVLISVDIESGSYIER